MILCGVMVCGINCGIWVYIKGRVWHVIKKMYESSESAVLLEREKSDVFIVEQGMAQGCILSPILFIH